MKGWHCVANLYDQLADNLERVLINFRQGQLTNDQFFAEVRAAIEYARQQRWAGK